MIKFLQQRVFVAYFIFDFNTLDREAVISMEVRRRKLSAYERVVGLCEKPPDTPSSEILDKELFQDKTRKEKFFDAVLALINNPIFNGIVIAAILFNMIVLILLTYPEYAARFSYFFTVCDSFFLGVYHVEAIVKLIALGRNYFKNGWNLLDFFILLTSWLDFLFPFFLGASTQATRVLRVFRAMRALRALRMLRTIAFLHSLQTIVNTVFSSVSSMVVILVLMLLFMYMFAVMGRQLYAAPSPYYFGDLFRAVTTLFQLLTFDSWFYMYDDVTRSDSSYWHFIIFAISYTLVEYFVFLNLFMAVLVDNFQSQLKHDDITAEADLEIEEFMKEIKTEKDSEKDEQEEQNGTEWPSGYSTSHYNPYLEDFGHRPMEERIIYVQFYRLLCSLDYHAYIQKQNYSLMHKLLDKCQDPRLLLNSQSDHD
ncbi:cation channel sperm-associated protein 1-like [Paramacrobiotus metropolitanus]|uniref:cation channel sperm-associated protein 1-like n=1 Tax=Paramacrobiotus metropolitanus TaxID=2943436 RepID=UPI002445C068|nr:cation channel sperm-associated protein 1-like [Paramacrobiotus metropolitanus]